MISQFDKALDAILENIKPHERDCAWAKKSPYCAKRFAITPDDIKFYNKLRVPPPTLCPPCRRMRRLAFGYMLRFYKTKCQVPGHSETVISTVPSSIPLTIYDWEYYRTYEWNPEQYARELNPRETFFDFFWKMRQEVPQPAIVRDASNIDSDYTMNGPNLKHAYFVSSGWNSEYIYYTVGAYNKSQNCMDCYELSSGTECYEVVISRNMHNAAYVYFSNDCYNTKFVYDCKNCHDCFGSVNLRNKSYCFFNEQLTKEEYEKRMTTINLGNRDELRHTEERFWKLVKANPVRGTRNEQALNSVGNFILQSRNCYECYKAEKGENLRYADTTIGNKDSMDYAVSGGSELLYETTAVGSQCSNVKFSFGSKFITDSEFVINCRNVNNCFACIGLENKSYCIFNKQYTPEEYAKLVDELKTAMLERGEYGEFFSFKFSPYAYIDTFASLVFPLEKETMESLEAYPGSPTDEDTSSNLRVLTPEEIPKDISQVTDEILKKTLICEITGRPFRIIKEELEFYRQKNLPLPTVHPNERIRRRYLSVHPARLFDDTCANCHKAIKSMYKTSDGFRPYCENCYQKEIV